MFKNLQQLKERLAKLVGFRVDQNGFAAVDSHYIESEHPRLGGKWIDKAKMPKESVVPDTGAPDVPGGDLAERLPRSMMTDEEAAAYRKRKSMLGRGAPSHRAGQPIPPTSYGYWVSPTGSYYPVDHQQHEAEAHYIHRWNHGKKAPMAGATNALLDQGWARVIHNEKDGTQVSTGIGDNRRKIHKHLVPLLDYSIAKGKPVRVESHGPGGTGMRKSLSTDDYGELDRWGKHPSTEYKAESE